MLIFFCFALFFVVIGRITFLFFMPKNQKLIAFTLRHGMPGIGGNSMSVVRIPRAFRTLTVVRPKSATQRISVGGNRGFHEGKPTLEMEPALCMLFHRAFHINCCVFFISLLYICTCVCGCVYLCLCVCKCVFVVNRS